MIYKIEGAGAPGAERLAPITLPFSSVQRLQKSRESWINSEPRVPPAVDEKGGRRTSRSPSAQLSRAAPRRRFPDTSRKQSKGVRTGLSEEKAHSPAKDVSRPPLCLSRPGRRRRAAFLKTAHHPTKPNELTYYANGPWAVTVLTLVEVLAFARSRVYYPTNPTPPPGGFAVLTSGDGTNPTSRFVLPQAWL